MVSFSGMYPDLRSECRGKAHFEESNAFCRTTGSWLYVAILEDDIEISSRFHPKTTLPRLLRPEVIFGHFYGLALKAQPIAEAISLGMTTTESPCKHARNHRGPDGALIRNWILNNVPDEEFQRIRPHLETMSLIQGTTVLRQESEVSHAIFPNSGLVSLLVMMTEGRSSEASIAGCEGMVGVGLVGGLSRSVHSGLVQVAGDALRISADRFRECLEDAPQFRDAITRFCVIQLMLISQTAACNRLHPLEKRLARWLLLCQDRLSSETISTTHDLLATLLGTDRPSITLAAQKMQSEGVIRTTRGHLTVLARPQLEQFSCECYAAGALEPSGALARRFGEAVTGNGPNAKKKARSE
jgi:CRP-like cAMP-binding protein